MPSEKSITSSSSDAPVGIVIERAGDVLIFTLDNAEHGNEVTGPMFDLMLAELRAEAYRPHPRVLRIRARGKVFCIAHLRIRFIRSLVNQIVGQLEAAAYQVQL